MDYRDYPYYYSPFPLEEEDQLFQNDMLYDFPIDRQQGQGFPGVFGPPGSFPPGPPPGVPGGGQQAGGPPTSPPPTFTPQLQAGGAPSVFAVDPGAIRGCLYRYTYIWLQNGQSFWFYPVFVGRTSIAGWRWRNWRWVYFGTDLRRIRSFQCF